MGITLDWWRYFLSQDPDFDWTAVTPDGFERFWEQSVEQYGIVIGSDDPDLSAFRDRGGKAIVWHAPQTLAAVLRDRDGQVTRTRPLCPYPQVARYRGRGSTDDAANFSCAADF